MYVYGIYVQRSYDTYSENIYRMYRLLMSIYVNHIFWHICHIYSIIVYTCNIYVFV